MSRKRNLYYSKGYRWEIILLIIQALFVFVALLSPLVYNICAFYHQETISGVLIEKYTKVQDRSGKFFVVVESGNETIVLQNSDNTFAKKFNSADVQANFKIGQTYTFTVVGWRVPFFSLFKNIIAVRQN